MISHWEFSPETLFQSAFFFFLFQDLLLLDPKIDEIRFYLRVLFKKKLKYIVGASRVTGYDRQSFYRQESLF